MISSLLFHLVSRLHSHTRRRYRIFIYFWLSDWMNSRFRVGREILMWETSENYLFIFCVAVEDFGGSFFSLGFYPAPVFGCTSTEKLVFSVEVIFCRVSRHHDKMWLCEKLISNCMFCLQILEGSVVCSYLVSQECGNVKSSFCTAADD